MSEWRQVDAKNPCPICGKPDWCGRSVDGSAVRCMKSSTPVPGWDRGKQCDDGGTVFHRRNRPTGDNGREAAANAKPPEPAGLDWAQEVERCAEAINEAQLARLADKLGVRPESLRKLGVGRARADDLSRWSVGFGGGGDYPKAAYTFPERDADGRVVGLSCRALNGRKGTPKGAKRGLIVPDGFDDKPDPVLVVEGASDVAACLTMGVTAIGRPSNASGAKLLGERLKGREVIVVGENDPKSDGSWPGRDGAASIADQLTAAWGRSVARALTPDWEKDVRDWLRSRNPDLSSETACRDAGRDLVAALQGNPIRAPIGTGAAQIGFPPPVPLSELEEPGPVPWVWTGFLAAGFITLLTGLWKAGKTTLVSHLIKATKVGGDLAGVVNPSRVLVVSEESAKLWRIRRDRERLGANVDVLCRPILGRCDKGQWTAFVSYLQGLVVQHQYDLVVLDTLASFWPVNDENNSSEVMTALMPLRGLSDCGASLLLVHHPRKSEGAEGKASRGSGALTGFVDVIVELRRDGGDSHATRRRALKTYSRFDESPDEVIIELTDDGYVALGTRDDASRENRQRTITNMLVAHPDGMTSKEVVERWPKDGSAKPGTRTIQLELQAGADAWLWRRAGTGRKADPYRYFPTKDAVRANPAAIGARKANGVGEQPKRTRRRTPLLKPIRE